MTDTTFTTGPAVSSADRSFYPEYGLAGFRALTQANYSPDVAGFNTSTTHLYSPSIYFSSQPGPFLQSSMASGFSIANQTFSLI